jgi:hypothetical protein
MSGMSSTAAQAALQYLLSASALQLQFGCAHFFVSFILIASYF